MVFLTGTSAEAVSVICFVISFIFSSSVLGISFSELSISIIDHVNQLIDAGEKPMDAIKKVAKIHGVKKQEVYNEYHNEN